MIYNGVLTENRHDACADTPDEGCGEYHLNPKFQAPLFKFQITSTKIQI